jgi:hypothetical protein
MASCVRCADGVTARTIDRSAARAADLQGRRTLPTTTPSGQAKVLSPPNPSARWSIRLCAHQPRSACRCTRSDTQARATVPTPTRTEPRRGGDTDVHEAECGPVRSTYEFIKANRNHYSASVSSSSSGRHSELSQVPAVGETQRTLFGSACAIACPPAKANGVWPSNAWLRDAL